MDPDAVPFAQGAPRQAERVIQPRAHDLDPDVFAQQELGIAGRVPERVRDEDQQPRHAAVLGHVAEQSIDPARPLRGLRSAEIAPDADDRALLGRSVLARGLCGIGKRHPVQPVEGEAHFDPEHVGADQGGDRAPRVDELARFDVLVQHERVARRPNAGASKVQLGLRQPAAGRGDRGPLLGQVGLPQRQPAAHVAGLDRRLQ